MKPVYPAKLTAEDVVKIRNLANVRDQHLKEAKKLTSVQLGKQFGVSKHTIEKIIGYRAWTHIL